MTEHLSKNEVVPKLSNWERFVSINLIDTDKKRLKDDFGKGIEVKWAYNPIDFVFSIWTTPAVHDQVDPIASSVEYSTCGSISKKFGFQSYHSKLSQLKDDSFNVKARKILGDILLSQ